jgi:carbon starvation protein
MSSKPQGSGIIRILGWSAVIALGTGAVAILAFVRGEPVSSLWMVVAAVCVFAVSYRFHSAWLLAKVLTVDDFRAPPSVVKADRKDFVATPRWVVFGHHFAAIAGPGPLVGPVLAAQFGYLPGLLWMLIGATLGGAVHDSVILFCSIRRGGKSLGQMVKDEVGPFAGLVTLVGIVTIMVMILAVLALVVVKALTNSPWGLSTIAATIPIALVMGIAMRSAPNRLGWISGLGIVALLFAVWGGQYIAGSRFEAFFTLTGPQLAWTIIIYGMLSVLPVWVLLAPRDYLSSFMKIGTVAALAGAIVILAPALKMPAVTPFIDGSGPVFAGPVFPFCFITIACAAISGFHSLIASGTTPKLISSEHDIRTIAYGGMITEMCVGVMALIAACSMQPGEYFAVNMAGDPAAVVAKATSLGYPVTASQMAQLAASVGEKTMIGRTGGAPTFALGMAHIFAGVLRGRTALALWYHFAIMFEAMFILTTIDAGTRVGRFLVQDFLGLVWKPFSNTRSLPMTAAATAIFISAWGWFLYQGVIDPMGGINSLWPIFGIANQLLAVIALTFGTTVLIKMNRKRYAWVTLLPLGWLLSVTMTAGWMKIFSDDPRLGFLSGARAAERAMAGASPADASVLAREILNARVDAAVTGFYLIMVVLIVLSSARMCFNLLGGRNVCAVREEPYIPISALGRPGLET